MIDAMDANEGQGKNMLPRTELFGVHYPNLLIPVERADEWQASGEHVDGAYFQVALASCRLPETVRLCIKTIICMSCSLLLVQYSLDGMRLMHIH
jgi:hypothetical protein